ncbi:hypothetical protein FJZ48_03285 [Candidatus Uhrbacteria bacterium]|nr:hypothetical protein [Candidatus Uhrbacteria bacterium]
MKLITIKGTWEQMGRQLGMAQKKDIQSIQAHHLRVSSRMKRLLKEQSALLRDQAKNQWDFLVGMSIGSGQPLENIIIANSWEYFAVKAQHCSTVFGVEKRQWFVLHNEDDYAWWKGKVALVRYIPNNGTDVLTFNYPGTIAGASVGINARGLSLAMNSIYQTHDRLLSGLPSYIVGSQLLQAKSMSEVMRMAKLVKTNMGMHFLMVESDRRAVSLELFPHAKDHKVIRPWFAHTNHPLLSKVQKNAFCGRRSIKRLERVHDALEETKNFTQALACLRKPFARGGVYEVAKDMADVMTLATVIVWPAQRKLTVIDKNRKRDYTI